MALRLLVHRLEEFKPPPGVHNLEAMHTLALFWALLGMCFPVTFATVVYWGNNTSYYAGADADLPHETYAFTPQNAVFIEPNAEPFSSLANISYFTAGRGLYLMPFLSGDFMPRGSTSIRAVRVYLMVTTIHHKNSKMNTTGSCG